ncbi:MAG: hypothetical protein JWN24_3328 [Phycisphaerales bacterium]|jgi:hypothetical protein|nr:hypothetical protein [Phycisphaerales bacterium]
MRIPLTIIFALPAMLWSTISFAADPPAAATKPAQDQAALEKRFEKTLTSAVLVGHFTTDGDDKGVKEDRYTISSVKKMKGDYWLFTTRIQFGTKDVNVPLMLPVIWAGDTPIITVTDVGVPGIGTYTARVLIYDDHYAGTWSGGAKHGGTLAGVIEHPAAKGADTDK